MNPPADITIRARPKPDAIEKKTHLIIVAVVSYVSSGRFETGTLHSPPSALLGSFLDRSDAFGENCL
jgi:hypothetical protein